MQEVNAWLSYVDEKPVKVLECEGALRKVCWVQAVSEKDVESIRRLVPCPRYFRFGTIDFVEQVQSNSDHFDWKCFVEDSSMSLTLTCIQSQKFCLSLITLIFHQAQCYSQLLQPSLNVQFLSFSSQAVMGSLVQTVPETC